MSLSAEEADTVLSWNEPEGVNPRGTVVVVPGRGERPAVYERFGRRLAADGYRVHAVTGPAGDQDATVAQVTGLADGPGPFVLAGSDTGALFAAGVAASGQIAVAALVLAGLPTADEPGTGPGAAAADEPAAGPGAADAEAAWAAELEARTACPTHRGRLAGPVLRRGALYEPVPDGWLAAADLAAVAVPVLGLHGAADPVSPLEAARERYASAPRAELVSITDGRHDAFNDITHRTASAVIVQFLERLRSGPELTPIAVNEKL